jgi:hypothetical protein
MEVKRSNKMHQLKRKGRERDLYALSTRFSTLVALVEWDTIIPNCRVHSIYTTHLSDYVNSYSGDSFLTYLEDSFLNEELELEVTFENGHNIDLVPISYADSNTYLDMWINLSKDGLFRFDAERLKKAKEAEDKYFSISFLDEDCEDAKKEFISSMTKLNAIQWDDFFIFPDLPFLRFYI